MQEGDELLRPAPPLLCAQGRTAQELRHQPARDGHALQRLQLPHGHRRRQREEL